MDYVWRVSVCVDPEKTLFSSTKSWLKLITYALLSRIATESTLDYRSAEMERNSFIII